MTGGGAVSQLRAERADSGGRGPGEELRARHASGTAGALQGAAALWKGESRRTGAGWGVASFLPAHPGLAVVNVILLSSSAARWGEK